MDLKTISEKAVEALRIVGDYVAESQSNIQSIKLKGIKNPQTDVDVAAEDMLCKKLKEILPEAGFINEESGESKQDEYNWTIDPIDGTKFFSTQYPVYFSQISLLKNDRSIFAAIYVPLSKQMFYAIKDLGTYLNGEKIELEYDGPLSESILNIEIGKLDKQNVSIEFVSKLGLVANRVMTVSGIFAPYLITNTIQAYIRYYNGENFIYDLEPRFLVIKEAGGVVHEHNYKGRKLFIAAHPKLVNEIEQVLELKND